MAAVLTVEHAITTAPPVVVVGAGPAGVRCVQELHRLAPRMPIVLYGAESWQPYNRVRLSSALAGELSWGALTADTRVPESAFVDVRFDCAVRSIDGASHIVRDAHGRSQPYSQLVLATGSTPHVPDTPGMRLSGVFTFRDMSDAQRLLARRVRSRTTVIVGGGLLGLEAARAMRRFHTHVVVVEHSDRLMSRQLDTGAGRALARRVQAEGIEIVLSDGVIAVAGHERVAGVNLRSGRNIHCDTLIVATGIRPNIALALDAGVSVGRGIRVDDELRTSHPDIFAVGECAEHRGQLYGIVAPGLEQAAVAAHVIAGAGARYAGSVAATRLKVLRCPVFSIGETGNDGLGNLAREVLYERDGAYRKLIVRRGRLAGAIAVGDWSELSRVQEAVTHRRRVFPWQVARFRRDGRLWPAAAAASVVSWPASATVCNCTGVTCGALRSAFADGCHSVSQLAARTGASTVCGSCRPLLADLVGAGAVREPVRAARTLAALALAAAIAAAAIFFSPAIPYPRSADIAWHWDQLWRQGLYKQTSGFVLLGLMAALGAVSLRKRWRRLLALGDYGGWRVAHVALGVALPAALLVHSGGRLGGGLNGALSTFALAAALLGAGTALVVAREHRIGAVLARRLREASLWTHVLMLWPLPILLLFHVLKTYYF